jgi:ABC-type transporter Mla subunit MlaD
MSFHSIFSRLFPSCQTTPPITTKVPTIVEAIQSTDAETNAALQQVELLRAQLNQAEQHKRSVLESAQQTIEASLNKESEQLEAAKSAHAQQLQDLENHFNQRRAALESQIKNLSKVSAETVGLAEAEFQAAAQEANSRAQLAKDEIARIEKLLGNP